MSIREREKAFERDCGYRRLVQHRLTQKRGEVLDVVLPDVVLVKVWGEEPAVSRWPMRLVKDAETGEPFETTGEPKEWQVETP